MSTGSNGAVASALVAAACTTLLIHTIRSAQMAHDGAKERRFQIFLSASLLLLVIMHILQCVFAADPHTDIRMAQLVVHLLASVALSATAVQGWMMRCQEGDSAADERAFSRASTVKGGAHDGGGLDARTSLSFFSISRRARTDSPGPAPPSGGGGGSGTFDDEGVVPVAMLREKFRLESKLREARRLVIQFTTSLNILHYCTPTHTPRRPFALTSMPRGESLLASLPPFDFEPLSAVVARLNDEVTLRVMRAPPSVPSSPASSFGGQQQQPQQQQWQVSVGQTVIPLPVVWQQLRDVERLLLHPVAVELFKAFLAQQTTHAAFPAVEPVAAAMLILDAKRLPIAERSTLPKLLANFLSCYLGRCDESAPPPCILPLSSSLLSRFTAALVQWKSESSNPQATLGAAELLKAVQALFAEAVIECTHWLAMMFLPAFQQSSCNKLAQFCVGYTDSTSELPTVRRAHSDPKSSAASGAATASAQMPASQRNLCLPSSTPPSRRPLSVKVPPSVASRSRVLNSPPSRSVDGGFARASFGWNATSASTDRSPTLTGTHTQQHHRARHSSFEMGALEALALKSSTPSPQQQAVMAPQMEPPSLGVRPRLSQWKSNESASAPAAPGSPSTHSAPVSALASTAPHLVLDREWSPGSASPNAPSSPAAAGSAASGSFSTFRFPSTNSYAGASPQMSLRKAVLIAAQEVATPTLHSTSASTAAALAMQPPPATMHLESTPEESSSTRPSSGSVSASESSFHPHPDPHPQPHPHPSPPAIQFAV